jgi:type I restriction enzyme S subunit
LPLTRVIDIRLVNDNLLATTQAIYKSWFADFEPFGGVCPQNWLCGCVDDIAEFYDSMRKPLSSLERADMERIYPYYGAVSIVDYVDDFIFDGEYLLVSEDGIYVVDENGHPLLQHITGKFWANNHAHILKGKAGFNEDSLYLFLANTNMTPIVTGAAQPKINQANLKSFPITIPTSEVIEHFNVIIQPFFDQRLSNEAEIKKLENLKDLLLTRLVD